MSGKENIIKMAYYSSDVNVYVESRSPIQEKKLPAIPKAVGVYRRVARNLADMNKHEKEITEAKLSNDYIAASELFKENVIRIYQILGAKGGLTQEEWDLMKTSASKGNYIFPDISLRLGTTMKFQLDDKSAETFIKSILEKSGYSLKILPSSGSSALYEDESKFLEELANSLSVNMVFEIIEQRIDNADYAATKNRLHYLTIYDFLEHHFGLGKNVPDKSKFLEYLDTCKDKESAYIIDVKKLISDFSGDFWAEYDKYREFKMIQILARWYGKSEVRVLSGAAYNFFHESLSEEMFSKALKILRVHTASLNPRKSKSETTGTNATFNFEIERLNGDVYALVNQNNYAASFTGSPKKLKLSSDNCLTLSGLEYGKTYCVSLWEVMGKDDTVKLGDLPSVTPGVKWPAVKSVSKTPSKNNLNISVIVSGGEGNISYMICMKKNAASIASVNDGEKIKPKFDSEKLSTTITATINSLEYDTEYVFCVFALIDGGKYCTKIVPDFKYIPKKLKLHTVIRKASARDESSTGTISLDFAERKWPDSFGNQTVTFACRTDRFPENPDDSEANFTINSMDINAYRNSVFKLKTAQEKSYAALYICGWLKDGQLVVQNAIYEIRYTFSKKNILSFDIWFNKKDIELPKMRIFCFDRKDNIIFKNENLTVGSEKQIQFQISGKVDSVLVEAADPLERQIYLFRNENTLDVGKSKLTFLGSLVNIFKS